MKYEVYSDKFLAELSTDPLEGVIALCERFLEIAGHNNDLEVGHYLDALAAILAFCDSRGIAYDPPNLPDTHEGVFRTVFGWIQSLQQSKRAELLRQDTTSGLSVRRALYAERFGGAQGYDFSPEDFAQIQKLISELRELIASSRLLDSRHRLRLLKRLEAMQVELHERNSDIDRFWGFIAEVGVAVRKFGEDLKSISDRAHELAKLVVAAIMVKEGITALPTIVKLLEK